jgi:hypothetical protein
VTQDPLGVWADRVNLGNDYLYAGCNPLTLGDRTGLQSAGDGAVMLIQGGSGDYDSHMSIRAVDSKGDVVEVSFGANGHIGVVLNSGGAYADGNLGGTVIGVTYTNGKGIERVMKKLREMTDDAPSGVYSLAKQNCRWWSRWMYFFLVVSLHDLGLKAEEGSPDPVNADWDSLIRALSGGGATTTVARGGSIATAVAAGGAPSGAAGGVVVGVASLTTTTSKPSTTTTRALTDSEKLAKYGPEARPAGLPDPSKGEAPNPHEWLKGGRK